MKTIFINGDAITEQQTPIETIAQALALYFSGKEQSTFALALNGEFVGKEDYSTTKVNHNDSLDLLFPIQGG